MDQITFSQLYKLEERYNKLRASFLLLVIFNIAFIGLVSMKSDPKPGVLRVKGLVVVDSLGRDRILIGAPIPFSKNRVRTDTAQVRKYWAKTYGKQANEFMNWYKDYQNSAVGMVVLNEHGFDRVQLGDQLSDPNSGRRQFEVAGLLWNDKQGWELGGAGVNTDIDGKSRAVIGLDDRTGEAVHLVALEDGTKGLIIGGENGRMLLGMSKAKGEWFKNEKQFAGWKFFDAEGKQIFVQAVNEQ